MNTAFKDRKTGNGGTYMPLILGALFMATAPFISLPSAIAEASDSDTQCINPSPEISAEYGPEPRDIFFDYESASIRGDAKPVLSENTEILKRNPDLYVIIQGEWTINETGGQELAQLRAEAVKDYMVTKGIDSDRILTSTLCSELEKDLVQSEEINALSRRVHFISMEFEQKSFAYSPSVSESKSEG